MSWNAYPRPQMKRDLFYMIKENWTLNGQTIRVPFVPQSVLSGYEGEIGNTLTYETVFTVPETFVWIEFLYTSVQWTSWRRCG